MTQNDANRFFRMQGDLKEVDLRAAVEFLAPGTSLSLTMRVLAESALRHGEADAVDRVRDALHGKGTLSFRPFRVLMQDSAGMPALLDFASLRDALVARDRDPGALEPALPVHLVVDHSISAVHTGQGADRANLDLEYKDNEERFTFLRWAETKLRGVEVVPPGNGIVHQINLERLTEPVRSSGGWLLPDSMIGTDSHSTMVGGAGVLGWGVGGIEATAVMLGLPIEMPPPTITGVRLDGALRPGILATDLALQMTAFLRQKGVVGHYLEFFGPGVAGLSAPDRATVSNMAPEYGATAALFGYDRQTADHLIRNGRHDAASRASAYWLRQGIAEERSHRVAYHNVLEFDLSKVGRTVSGPSLPHQVSARPIFAAARPAASQAAEGKLADGDIVMAAITSCTNTANPRTMVTAGMLAANAAKAGLTLPPYVKASLSPGSRRVPEYLAKLGLLEPLERLGFSIVGYGCMTCVGNSGDLAPEILSEIKARSLNVASVLSGNRNFQSRIHPLVESNYLMSPALVVAYALAGSVTRDIDREPIGEGRSGPVRLSDIWPAAELVDRAVQGIGEIDEDRTAEMERWSALPLPAGKVFPWKPGSTYLKRQLFRPAQASQAVLEAGRPLLSLGDFVTTDHISPVGRIDPESPAGEYLLELGVLPADFNSYGGRRGNPEVMVRGTFANARLDNRLSPRRGYWTTHQPSGEVVTIDAAARRFREAGVPSVVFAGNGYGAGSARDWAAKGTFELGVRVVVAKSFERIHRSNLALVGVLPLIAADDIDVEGDCIVTIAADRSELRPNATLKLSVQRGGQTASIDVLCRLDTEFEVQCWRAGGMFNYWLAKAG